MGVTGLWEPFGLRSSPFFQEELTPADPDHPTSLFVGRVEDILRVKRRIASDPHTRTIVEGDPGVGKTSFVNRIKADADELGLVSWQQPVRITQETTLSSFLADVLRTLLRIRSASGLSNSGGRIWPRIVRWLEGDEVRSGSVSVLGVGAGLSRSHVPPRAPAEPLHEFLSYALAETTEEFGRSVLVHVNNLENLTAKRTGQLALLMRDLRDYLLLPGAHWVIVGTVGVERDVFRTYDQVGGIFPAAVVLAPLSPSEMQELLRRRFEHLARPGGNVTYPVDPAQAAGLYQLYRGDLRNFLRLLGDAAERVLGVDGIRPMTAAEVLKHASAEYAERFRAALGNSDFESLRSLVASRSEQDHEFRVTDATKVLDITQPTATRLVERLVVARVIRQTRTEGRSVFYRPIGEALVALGAVPPA